MRNKILIDREKRMDTIKEIISNDNCFVIAIKCNICGDDKNINEANIVKKYFLNEVCKCFEVQNVLFFESFDGNYYLVKINKGDELEIKRTLVNLEDCAIGRYVDLDLYTNLEKSITRSDLGVTSRKCIICGDEPAICMRSSKHSVEEVISKTIQDIRYEAAKLVANACAQSMIEEVSAHPKFGLVTKQSSGKHNDMNYDTFIKSIDAIEPFLVEYAMEGYCIDDTTFPRLREIGKRAEVAMFEATDNVNTHKGSIFILGFVIPSIVDCLYNDKSFDMIETNIKFLGKDILNDFLTVTKPTTYGEELYLKYRITGIRGEVKKGLKSVFSVINDFENYPGDNNQLVIDMIARYMSFLNDTVILHKNDIGFLDFVKSVGQDICDAGGCMTTEGSDLVDEYTQKFIDANISPGGSADMVITSLLLLKVKCLFVWEI